MIARDAGQFIELTVYPTAEVVGGRIAAANREFCRISGYSCDELVGMRLNRVLVDSGELLRHAESSRGRSIVRGNHTGVLVKKDGQMTEARFVVRPSDPGVNSGGMLVVLDIKTGQNASGTYDGGTRGLLDQCLQIAEAGVVVVGRNGLVALVNRKCCELLGYQDLEIVGRHWASIFTNRHIRRQANEYFERLVSGKVQPKDRYETTVSTKGGQKKIVSWHHTTLLRDSSGEVLGLVSSLLDLTEERRTLKTLEDRERIYRLVSENATAGVWTYDIASGRVTYMSPSISQITGFSGEEVTGMGLEQILTPESRALGLSVLQRELAQDKDYHGGPHSWTLELEEYRKDGSIVWVEVRTSVMRDAQGRPTGIFGITRDITERKQAEKALRESEKRYRTFFENSMDATCIVGINGKIIDVNRAALALLGYSRDELTKRSLADIAPLEQRLELQRQIEKSGFVRNFEMQLRRSDGVYLDCLLTFDARRDDYGDIVGYEGSFRDITEWKRVQRNLHLYVNEVTKAQENERLRLSRELHDGVLQNLLALGLELEKVIRAEKRNNDSWKTQLQHVRDELRRLANEMRALSHAIRPSVLDELGLVAAVQTTLHAIEETRGMKTDLEVMGVESRLCGELELALFRIIQEALNNVKQHSEARSVRVQIEFGSTSVKATIVDDGKGFEPPSRLSDLTPSRRLGLIGMEERARMFGGRFELQSSPSAGTRIVVEIPYVESESRDSAR